MKKPFGKIVHRPRNRTAASQPEIDQNKKAKKHIVDLLASIAQVLATIVAVFALLQAIDQSNSNLKLSRQLVYRDSINRAKDAFDDSLKLVHDRLIDSFHFLMQIQNYEKQVSALDSQYLLAKLQFDTNNVDRKRAQSESKIQFAYQDSINKQQIKALNEQIAALNQQSLIALRQARLTENQFLRDSILLEDDQKNSEAQFFFDLRLSKLKFNWRGFYRTVNLVITNIGNRSADSVVTSCVIMTMQNNMFLKKPTFITPGEMKPNEARSLRILDVPTSHWDPLVLIIALNYRDKLSSRILPTAGCIRIIVKSNGDITFPTDFEKATILDLLKENDVSTFNELSEIHFQ